MTGGQSLLPVDAATQDGPDAAICARRVLYAQSDTVFMEVYIVYVLST